MINENLRYLPYSSRRYKANSDGKIFHSDGTPIAIDNGLVRLDWIDGSRLYWAGTVILAAFGKLELPDHLWSEVEPMVVDGDASNLSINNLLYRFRGGRIEVETHPGFYYVPFYSKYGINAEGVLINIETGKERVWSILPPSEKRAWTGGYAYAKVPPNPDGSTSLFRHRALCLVFRSYPPSVMKMVVNHRNGIPGDDRLDNI
ncbi:MAG TPA: hypothetical protein VN081_00520, partial [Dongiaceae bacterium]|nr:hypothetical protein [Dongiaceae bacterium]